MRAQNLSGQELGRRAGSRAIRAIRNLYSGEAPEWLPAPARPPLDALGPDAGLQQRRVVPLEECKVRSTPTDVTVVADLPGVKPSEVFFDVGPGRVTISSEIRLDASDVDDDPLWQLCREVRRGRYNQTVPIPDGLLVDRWSATFEDSVLRVRIPRVGRHTTAVGTQQH